MLTLTVPEAAASTDEIQFKLVLDGQPPEVLITHTCIDIGKTLTPLVDLDRVS